MDWTDPDKVCDALSVLEGLPDLNGSVRQQLPYAKLGIDPHAIDKRTLAGFTELHLITGETDSLLDRLEHALRTGDLELDLRQYIHATIADIEAKKRQAAADVIQKLSGSRYPRKKRSIQQQDVAILSMDGERPTVRFGYHLVEARATQVNLGVEVEAAALLKALTHTLSIWRDRLSLGIDADFIWRYASSEQRVVLALVITIHAPELNMAQIVAEGMQSVIKNQLPYPEIYRFAPIREAGYLTSFTLTSDYVSAAQIVRQEVTFPYAGSESFAIVSLNVNSDRLRDLMLYLHSAPAGEVVDIQVRPTPVSRTEIEEALQAIDDPLIDPSAAYHRLNARDSLGDRYWQKLLGSYRETLLQLHQQAYEVRVRVASSTDADILPLAMVAGRSLFGLGAFDVFPATFGEVPVSLDSLMTPTLAPPELVRLRHIWSLAETAILTRLPYPTVGGIPGIPLSRIRPHRIPSNIPNTGCLLGHALPNGREQIQVRLPYHDRTRHTYVVGRTGTGKTTLLHNMALQDIEAGHGVGVIDPHGDLIDALMLRIPPDRADDVVLFDPADIARPLGLNLLDVKGPIVQNLAVSDFIGLMYSMYDPGHVGIVGPRFEQSVRNSMYTAMALPGATLIDVLRIISDHKYSQAVRKYLQDPVVKDYWDKIYEGQSDFHRSEVKDYITSKFSRFTSDRMIRQIIGQPHTSLDFRSIIESGKILLVNLSKGRVGEFNSNFLGFVLVSRLLIAAFQRVDRAVDARTPYHLYIDEFQNFATPGLVAMLTEGRKYGMALTLAHQFINQLKTEMREAVFGNVGTICAFQVGLRDAELLAGEMYPVFGVDDLVNMPSYHLAAKILANGETLMPFAIKTLPEQGTPRDEVGQAIRSYSRLTYGRNAACVEDGIRDQFNLPVHARFKNPA